MADINPPRFELTKVYSNGVVEEPEIYRIYELDGEWRLDRRNFLKAVGAGVSVVGAGLLTGCLGGDGGSNETPPNTDFTRDYSRTSVAHNSAINYHAINADSTILASVDDGGSLKFWEYPSGKHLKSEKIANITNSSTSVVFSPDGSLVASSWGNQQVRLWDASTGEPVLDINTEKDDIGELTFSPDGTKVAVTIFEEEYKLYGIDLYDASSGVLYDTLLGDSEPINAVAWSGSTLAWTSGNKEVGQIKVWYMYSTGGFIRQKISGHRATDLAFILSGLASGGAPDNEVKIWNTSTGELLDTLSDFGTVEAVPKSYWVISGSASNGIKIWDARTNEIVLEINETLFVDNIAASPEKTTFLSTHEGTVRIWDLSTGTPLADIKVEEDSTIKALSVSPDGLKFVTKSSATTIRVWDMGTRMQELVIEPIHTGIPRILGFNSAGELVTTAEDRTIKYWQAPEAELLRTQLTSPDMDGMIVVGNDYSIAALTAVDGEEVLIWDLNNEQELLRLPGNGSKIEALEFSPDGSLLASASADNSITLWDLAAVKQTQVLTDEHHQYLAFNPDGTRLASSDFEVHIWDVQTGDLLMNLVREVKYESSNLTFSPDGKFLAITGSKIELWEMPTGEPIQSWGVSATCLASLGFDGESRYLIATSKNGKIQTWKTPTGEFLTSYFDPHAILYYSSLKYFSLVNDDGEAILYTLPCDSYYVLPEDAVCTCNCVAGTSTKQAPGCPSSGGGPGGGGGGGSICTCNLVCTCVPVYF